MAGCRLAACSGVELQVQGLSVGGGDGGGAGVAMPATTAKPGLHEVQHAVPHPPYLLPRNLSQSVACPQVNGTERLQTA